MKENIKIYFIKASDAHLSWPETKHNFIMQKREYDNYKLIISKIKPRKSTQLPVLLSATLHISKKTKIKITEVKQFTLNLLDKMQPWMKSDILDAVFDNNIFSNSDLKKDSN